MRERRFESILHKVLHQVIKVAVHPRTLIQVTLQVTAVPNEDATSGRPSQAASVRKYYGGKLLLTSMQMLYLLPPLLNAAMLALLSTSIPLAMTVASVFLTVGSGGSVVTGASVRPLESASSVHAVAFSLQGELLMVESEGSFDLKAWESVIEIAKSKCLYSMTTEANQEDVEMKGDNKTPLEFLIRGKIEERFRGTEQWRYEMK